MKKNILITLSLFLTALLFASCFGQGSRARLDAATKISKLEKQVEELEIDLDKKETELAKRKNLEKQLNALIVKAYNEEDYVNLACYAKSYIALFPENELSEQYKKYFDSSVDSIIRYVAPDNKYNYTEETGNWEINNFVDEFGSETTTKYITTKRLIYGTFSDKNQTNSSAALEFIISSDSNFALSIYENGSNIEVLASKKEPINYEISIKDGYGQNYTMRGANTSDRIILNKAYSQTLHNILMKGGFIQVLIKSTRDGAPVTYRFNIQDPTFYNNAIRKIMKG